jgi:hypothetical protein
LRIAFTFVSRRFTDEQNNLVPARGEKIGEFRAEPARGKIREPPHIVKRFVSGSGGHDAIHIEP